MTTPVWDPPPSRPSLVPAWIGGALSFVMTSVVVVACGIVVHASSDRRYRPSGSPCAGLDVAAVATRLGIAVPSLEPTDSSGGCGYRIREEDGSLSGLGKLRLTYADNAIGSWLSWRYLKIEGDPREVPGLGRAARLTTWKDTSGKVVVCSVSLEVLDSNLIFRSQVTATAEMAAAPCDNMDAIGDALVESARTSIARLGEPA